MLKGRCSDCGNTVWKIEMVRGRCLNCWDDEAAENDGADDTALELAKKAAAEERERAINAVMLTTETAGLPVSERLGVVAAECALGMNIFRDFAASLRDVFGGRSEAVQKSMREARETALYELRKEAVALGADAVIAVDLDYSEIGGANMILIVASGTAVRLALPADLVERV